jgi:hypothetical protein
VRYVGMLANLFCSGDAYIVSFTNMSFFESMSSGPSSLVIGGIQPSTLFLLRTRCNKPRSPPYRKPSHAPKVLRAFNQFRTFQKIQKIQVIQEIQVIQPSHQPSITSFSSWPTRSVVLYNTCQEQGIPGSYPFAPYPLIYAFA